MLGTNWSPIYSKGSIFQGLTCNAHIARRSSLNQLEIGLILRLSLSIMLAKVTTATSTVRYIYFGLTWLMPMLFYGFSDGSLVNKSTKWKNLETQCSKSRLLMKSYLSAYHFDILHGTDTVVLGAKYQHDWAVKTILRISKDGSLI